MVLGGLGVLAAGLEDWEAAMHEAGRIAMGKVTGDGDELVILSVAAPEL